MLAKELDALRNERRLKFDDDPDSISEDKLKYIFTFRSRQAANKKIKTIKLKFPLLKDWNFG